MMIVAVPYATDAPIYHWPYATVGLIVLNTVVGLLTWPILWFAEGDDPRLVLLGFFVLQYGFFNPLAWITSNYLHADPFHLVGNMVLLWAYGIIVEGKIGWWRFLLLYNAIGFFQCGMEQILTMGFDEGASLGASAIVYGLVAIALVWAPMNEMQCVLIYAICLFIRVLSFECTVLMFSGVAIFIQLGLAILQISVAAGGEVGMGAVITSEIIHVMGAGTGFALGVAMLRLRWVDCENYDLFSVRTGRNQMSKEELRAEYLASAAGQAQERQKREQAQAEFRRHMAENQPLAALAAHRRFKQRFADWKLPEQDFVVLIALLRKLHLHSQSVPAMVEYLRTYSERTVAVRLALAEVLTSHLQRPGQALAVLDKIDGAKLDAAQRQVFEALYAKAQAAFERDPYEVAPEDW